MFKRTELKGKRYRVLDQSESHGPFVYRDLICPCVSTTFKLKNAKNGEQLPGRRDRRFRPILVYDGSKKQSDRIKEEAKSRFDKIERADYRKGVIEVYGLKMGTYLIINSLELSKSKRKNR